MKTRSSIALASTAFLAMLILILAGKFLRIQLDPDTDLVSPSIDAQTMTDLEKATVHIFNLKGTHLGRGFMTASQELLLTAAHVIHAECPTLDCQDLAFKVVDSGFHFRTFVMLIHKIHCSRWLDICALHSSPDASQAVSEIHWAHENKESYLVPLANRDERWLKRAEFKRLSSLGKLLTVNNRSGYSGSPLFDAKGALYGILSSGTETNALLAPAFIIADLLGYEDAYFGESYVMGGDEIQAVLSCRAANGDCFKVEGELLTKRFMALAGNADEWELFLQDNSIFWDEWSDQAPAFSWDGSFSDTWLLAALNQYVKTQDKTLQEHHRKAILAQLESQDGDRYGFVQKRLRALKHP
ncbi:hypothetical protein [Oligoflexus tunisiensis]|uniref:hypothetical protein n=1 Tax=Oligoflexus tunisiensis TaxID=708132 RepID=UPI00114C8FB9|nr:hypothetical protein [Oligoflexus tunisiensis]